LQSSEILLYGLMITNVFVVGAVLVWAWRRGHLDGMDSVEDLLFPDDEESSGGD
jgi:hypothetical protein